MKVAFVAALVAVAFVSSASSTEKWLSDAVSVQAEVSQSFESLKNITLALAQQMKQQQFFYEERVRTEGNSGIKQMRVQRQGTQNFFSGTHVSGSVAAMHEHANNIRTVGMGEVSVVMNGVDFRTRHNDYPLYMPHETSGEYHATQEIPFPEVPQAVLDKGDDVGAQAAELREWFKAFRDQNDTVRDYKKHFKPVLCYMEGAWTKTDASIEESFESDRHSIDAKTWFELQKKNMFTAASGSKSRLENLAYLPTSIIDIVDGAPVYAQWNYRILCHPLKRDLPLKRLRVVEDLSSRMRNDKSIFQHLHSRMARFQVNPRDEDDWTERPIDHGLLDELMEEIPGMDNYAGNIQSTDLDGNNMLNMDQTVKDASHYHRWYRVDAKDAMGLQNVMRSFSDANMFAAMTNQEKIASVSTERCKRKNCETVTQRWTYAIPMEIIFLTPLSKWNPHNLPYKGSDSQSLVFKSVTADDRTGACEEDGSKSFDGTNSKLFYTTPSEFYGGGEVSKDSADTSRGVSCVLDADRVSHQVRSAGTRIFLPFIHDVGVLRQRYPIMPIHGEGSSVWKELNALRSYVMNTESHGKFSWHSAVDTSDDHEFELATSLLYTPHEHRVILTAAEYRQLRGGVTLIKTTDIAQSHQHELTLSWNQNTNKLVYKFCGDARRCRDRHPVVLIELGSDEELGSK